MTRKAFAYITHRSRLLVFSHPYEPAAGLQVPAGTVRDNESPEEAALREAREETGLESIRTVSFLGDVAFDRRTYDGADEIHHRYFFHVACEVAEPPERWQHWELDPSDGGAPPLFELFWVSLPDGVPPLIAGHGALLPTLCGLMFAADQTR